MESFLSTLFQLGVALLVDEKIMGLQMVYVPHLSYEQTKDINWIESNAHSNPPFQLGVGFSFETSICKKTMAKCCVDTMAVMQRLAEVTNQNLKLQTKVDAAVMETDNFLVSLSKFDLLEL